MSLERGTRLGPYEIDSVLGAGGMGEVYRARDTRLKRDVAIKILPPAFAHDPDRLSRFQREAEVLAFMRSTQETSFDILLLSIRNPTQVRPWLKTAAYEGGAQLSPDGKWVAYVSNESGQNEVYLRAFTSPGRRWTISTEGGTQPLWNPNCPAVRAALCLRRGHHDRQLRRGSGRPAFHHGQGRTRLRAVECRPQLAVRARPRGPGQCASVRRVLGVDPGQEGA